MDDLGPPPDAGPDAAPEREDDGGADGVDEGDAGATMGDAGDAAELMDAAGSARDAAGGNMSDAADVPGGDAGSERDADGDPVDAADVGTPGAQDGSASEVDAPGSCTQPGWWYADDDGDGYGRASSRTRACAAPADGSWAETPGDCNDDDPRVHPEQSDYFDAPYEAPGGASSFDYDCSGSEEGNNLQATLASDYCGLLGLALCKGSGYLPVRPGAPNPWCGSQQKATCTDALLGALVCETSVDTVVDAYVCH